MIKVKSNKGITLVMLIITIVVLLIITGITINLSMDSVEQTINSQNKSEMLIIQHAIQERYVEYTQTNNEDILVGVRINDSINDKSVDEYYEYKLSTEQEFIDLGITGEGVTGSVFVVNYKTGYVGKEDSTTSPLQGYNEDSENNVTSNMIDIEN